MKPLNPAAIIGTAVVLGHVLGWDHPTATLVRVAPLGNGRLFPLTAYPGPLATNGKGTDARRHERSAFDVAVSAAALTPAANR